MRKYHVAIIGLCCIVCCVVTLTTKSVHKKITISKTVNVSSNYAEPKPHQPVAAKFEEVPYVIEESEDVIVLPDNYNGSYIEDDGKVYKDLSEKPLGCFTVSSVSSPDSSLIQMSESDAWSYLTDGMITEYPNVPYSQVESVMKQVYANHAVQIEIPIWYWANPSDDTDMSKVSKTIRLTVHDKVAPLFLAVFQDIYNDPSQPVFNIGDSGFGTWVLRGKNWSKANTPSAHAMGTAIDINPSSGTFIVDGIRYGNGYGNQKMTAEIWRSLPETHAKYHVLYEDCPIVSIFKAYGFYWGGDFSGTKDAMHLAFIGDGSNARERGYQNYTQYRR